MQISCYSCKKQIRFPADIKIVQCPSCKQIINVEQLQILQIKKLTSWRMVLLGLLLSFNYYILGPIFLISGGGFSNSAGIMVFLSAVGSPIAFTGLLMSIAQKLKMNNKRILFEMFFLIAVSINAYIILTMGSIG